ncbi:MAG: T9SS type A sorting domain-containing protein, partial [Bacteroidales bacterium]|nr:T9SS type A sorting domain-containing protein [Bacteroidales bacterium]
DSDPLFADDEFHLSEGSPCIDAGNPDSLYYDIEDPYYPGYALYPAMGTILNDMGTYGGHGYYEPPVAVDNYELRPATAGYELYNFPNPFNPSTTIQFSLPIEINRPRIEIFNIKGQKVETLECNIRDVASDNAHCRIHWNAKNHASGIYLYKLNIKNSPIKKMILLK